MNDEKCSIIDVAVEDGFMSIDGDKIVIFITKRTLKQLYSIMEEEHVCKPYVSFERPPIAFVIETEQEPGTQESLGYEWTGG